MDPTDDHRVGITSYRTDPGPIRMDIEVRRGDARMDFAQIDLLGGIVAR